MPPITPVPISTWLPAPAPVAGASSGRSRSRPIAAAMASAHKVVTLDLENNRLIRDAAIADARRTLALVEALFQPVEIKERILRKKLVEDEDELKARLIKAVDKYAGSLRRGRYPDDKQTAQVVAILRGVADQLDA